MQLGNRVDGARCADGEQHRAGS